MTTDARGRLETVDGPRDLASLTARLRALGPTALPPDGYAALAADIVDALRNRAAGGEPLASRRTWHAGIPLMHLANIASALCDLDTVLADAGEDAEAYRAARALVGCRRALAAEDPVAFEAHLAYALETLGARLCGLEDYEAAEPIRREAVDLLRRLHEQTGEYAEDLAPILSHYGCTRYMLGDYAAAADAQREAVGLYSQLFEGAPDEHRADLVETLNLLAGDMSVSGRWTEMLAVLKRAITIQREAPGPASPDDRYVLAGCLQVTANAYCCLDQPDAAANAYLEATRIYPPGDEVPEASLADYCFRLFDLERCHADAGRHAAALETLNMLLAALRRFDEDREPDAGALLADALCRHCTRLYQLDRFEEALSASAEAVERLSAAAERDFEAQGSKLIEALKLRWLCFVALGRTREVVDVERAVVDYLRRNQAYNPDAIDDLSNALCQLAQHLEQSGQLDAAVCLWEEKIEVDEARGERCSALGAMMSLRTLLHELGRHEEALRIAHEAVDAARTTADLQDNDLAYALEGLGSSLQRTGRYSAAAVAYQEAVDIFERLELPNPGLGPLSNLGVALSQAGQLDAAVTVLERAVDGYRALAPDAPSVYGSQFARALTNLGGCLAELNRTGAALCVAVEAVDVHRDRLRQAPDLSPDGLASALCNLGAVSLQAGHLSDARAATDEALAILQPLVEAQPGAFESLLAHALGHSARICAALGQLEDACRWVDTAVDVVWPAFERLPGVHAALLESLFADRRAWTSAPLDPVSAERARVVAEWLCDRPVV